MQPLPMSWTHWTKHKSRLDRDFGRKTWGDEGYAREELDRRTWRGVLVCRSGIDPRTKGGSCRLYPELAQSPEGRQARDLQCRRPCAARSRFPARLPTTATYKPWKESPRKRRLPAIKGGQDSEQHNITWRGVKLEITFTPEKFGLVDHIEIIVEGAPRCPSPRPATARTSSKPEPSRITAARWPSSLHGWIMKRRAPAGFGAQLSLFERRKILLAGSAGRE